jgi:hypothetical protein
MKARKDLGNLEVSGKFRKFGSYRKVYEILGILGMCYDFLG